MYVLKIRMNDESLPFFYGGLSNGTFWLTDEINHAVLFPDKASIYSMMACIDTISYNIEPHYMFVLPVSLEEFPELDNSVCFNYSYEIN